MKTTAYEDIALDLAITYDYYNTVLFDFIVEAVKNTIKDFEGKLKTTVQKGKCQDVIKETRKNI